MVKLMQYLGCMVRVTARDRVRADLSYSGPSPVDLSTMLNLLASDAR